MLASNNPGNGAPSLIQGNVGNSAAIVMTGPQDHVVSALTQQQRVAELEKKAGAGR